MFHHVKDLQFNARVSRPDPRFAQLLMDQFGGGNGELKAAMQYFVQAFPCRKAYPQHYDLLMDIATEEFSHLEIVGATITMLLEGVNGELKNAAEAMPVTQLATDGRGRSAAAREELIHQAMANPRFLTESGGGPMVTDANGVPWSGFFVNANGDLTVDLRSNIAAESRAKIVYEHLLKFTDDPHVRQSLRFLMTREITHFQQFSAALATLEPNFPPGVLQGDVRFTHAAYNMSTGEDARGPWNQGQGPWPEGEEWEYIENPLEQVRQTQGQESKAPAGHQRSADEAAAIEEELSQVKQQEVAAAAPDGGRDQQWSQYDGAAAAATTAVSMPAQTQGPAGRRVRTPASHARGRRR